MTRKRPRERTGPDLWDPAPLLRYARHLLGPGATHEDVGRLLDVPAPTISQWSYPSRPVLIRGRRVDEITTRLGVEPVMLWPDWYSNVLTELVDAFWVADHYILGSQWVRKFVTAQEWFPSPVPLAWKRQEWLGHQRSRVWFRDEVEAAMAARGYGPDRPGVSGKELARLTGFPYQTLINWSNRKQCFPAPVVPNRPKRWDLDEVVTWLRDNEKVAA